MQADDKMIGRISRVEENESLFIHETLSGLCFRLEMEVYDVRRLLRRLVLCGGIGCCLGHPVFYVSCSVFSILRGGHNIVGDFVMREGSCSHLRV